MRATSRPREGNPSVVSNSLVDQFQPAFDVLRPLAQTAPAVFNSPHSGRIYPGELAAMTRLDAITIRKSEDCYIDELFAGVISLGCPMLAARFPRIFLDVNREPYELDPAMFDGPLPSFVNAGSLRVAGGLGTIPRIVSENEPVYATRLTWNDARDRVERVYRPYHQALAGLLQNTASRFGHALLVDCHSMPSSAARLSAPRSASGADVIVGDRYGAACATDVPAMLESILQRFGLRVTHNKPYAGGYITQTYGRPQTGVHAVQIEINRGLYMNERTLQKARGFEPLRQTLQDAFAELIANLPDLLSPPALAAE